MRRFFLASLKFIDSSNSSLFSKFNFFIFSIPGPPTLKTLLGSSPSWIMRFAYSFVAAKCIWLIFVMLCLKASSKAPCVVSPPWICAIGICMILATPATPNISYLSPRSTNISGLSSASAGANFS